MPLIEHSQYNTLPWWSFNEHFETIIPSLFFKVDGISFDRERLEMDDGDFLDLDWLKNDNKQLLVLSHGLEGSTERHYIRRPAKFFGSRGWDILAWNNRGCSGEANRLPRSYHHGDVEDLNVVVEHALESEKYDRVVLLGISMGGCQTVKYLGSKKLDDRIKGAVTVSVSCDLMDSTKKINRTLGGFYRKRFVKKVKGKVLEKVDRHPELASIKLDQIQTFDEFHEAYTLKYFSLKSVEDFYRQSSCINYFDGVDRPLYILNALNDPMLEGMCFPYDLSREHAHIYLETPKHGGHVGFTLPKDEFSYMEYAAERFINEVINPFYQT